MAIASTNFVTQGPWVDKYVTDSHRAWLSKGEGGNVVFDRSASPAEKCVVIDWASMGSDEVAQTMVDALQRDGFFRLENHGMPRQLVQHTLEQGQALFELRGQEAVINKIQVQNEMRPEMKTARGYLGLLEEALNPKVGADLKETFDYGLAVCGGADETEHLGANLWPGSAELPLFKEVCTEYIDSAYKMTARLLQAILRVLKINEDDSEKLFEKPLVVNRLISYPPQPLLEAGTQMSMGAGSHVDYGALTVVYEDLPGLEVLGADSKWVTVPHIDGTFIVMAGFCLERLTNGLIQATPHRVQNHNSERRHSSTLFLDPNPQAVVAPLPAFVSEERPAQYNSCTAGHKGVLVGKAARSTLGYWKSEETTELRSAL